VQPSSNPPRKQTGVGMQAISLIPMAIPGKWRGIPISLCVTMGVSTYRSKERSLWSETMWVRETIDRHTDACMTLL
jgi:hypothetical protein